MSIYPSDKQETEWVREYLTQSNVAFHTFIMRRAAEHSAIVTEAQWQELESALELLVDYCNNIGEGCADEVMKAGAALERLYRARKSALIGQGEA